MHQVSFVCDKALPEDVEWAMVEDHGRFFFFVKRSAVSPRVLAEAWAAFRKLQRPAGKELALLP